MSAVDWQVWISEEIKSRKTVWVNNDKRTMYGYLLYTFGHFLGVLFLIHL